MVKQAPSLGRIIAMVVFTLSCFGLLIFLWLAFGGPIPIKPEGYRMKVRFPEAATLPVEADVRIAGVDVGKVKKKTLDKRGARTIAEVQLKSQYAPVSKDTRAILRQKTLLGETYVELAPGHRSSGMLGDGAYLPNGSVEDTVELGEILSSFDEPTRNAFKSWMKDLSLSVKSGGGQDLNDA